MSGIFKNIFQRQQIKKFNDLRKLKSMSDGDKVQYQMDKLKSILNVARNIPHYKDSIDLINFNEFNYGEFQKIPILTKDILRDSRTTLCNSAYLDKNSVFTNTSGGSTGEPVIFYQTKKQMFDGIGNFYYANYRNGVLPSDSTVSLWGAARDMHDYRKFSIKKMLKSFLDRSTVLNTFVMSNEIICEYINILNSRKPKFIKAYVHSIYEIAKYINEREIPISFVPVIQTTTGPLYPEIRNELKKAFNNCHIFNFYGSREVYAIASETLGSEGMEVMFDNVFVEILDENERPVKHGEEGEIYITTLNNEYMPLIRYKIGDRGIKGDVNEWVLNIKSVLGRTLGVIYRRDGSFIDGQFFTTLFFGLRGLDRFQLVQKSLDILELKIIPNSNLDPVEIDSVVARIKSEVGNCEVEIQYTDSIDLSATGKLMYVYSELS